MNTFIRNPNIASAGNFLAKSAFVFALFIICSLYISGGNKGFNQSFLRKQNRFLEEDAEKTVKPKVIDAIYEKVFHGKWTSNKEITRFTSKSGVFMMKVFKEYSLYQESTKNSKIVAKLLDGRYIDEALVFSFAKETKDFIIDPSTNKITVHDMVTHQTEIQIYELGEEVPF